MIGISSIIAGAAKPIADVIGKFVTRKEDQMLAMAEIEKIQNDVTKKILDNNNNTLLAQKEVVLSETQGHPLQRNWRPTLMWVIIAIIANNYLIAPFVNNILGLFTSSITLPVLELPDKLFNLMSIGLGGYVVGRSAEKILPQIKNKEDNKYIN